MIIICRSVNVDPVSINCRFLSKDGTRCNLYTAGRVSKPAVKSIIPVSRVSGQSIQCFVRPGLHGRLGDCTAIFIENNYVGFGGDGTIGLRFIRDWSMSADTSLLPEVIRLYYLFLSTSVFYLVSQFLSFFLFLIYLAASPCLYKFTRERVRTCTQHTLSQMLLIHTLLLLI